MWSKKQRQKKELEFAGSTNMDRIAPLADEFFSNVLFDEEPLFVSDEATIWDVSMSPTADELVKRCSSFYGTHVTAEDLRQPLWQLIEQLHQSRNQKKF